MNKKQLIALADTIIANPEAFGPEAIAKLAAFAKASNPLFKEDRWLGYIAGECGPNGGPKKGDSRRSSQTPAMSDPPPKHLGGSSATSTRIRGKEHTGFYSPHFDIQNPESLALAWGAAQQWMTDTLENAGGPIDFRVTTSRWEGDELHFFHITATRYCASLFPQKRL